MDDFDDLVEELKQKRDELRVQINLASREAKDEWEELETKMDEFATKAKQFTDDAKVKETTEGVGEALGLLGGEIKKGYERLWTAIRD
jgi:vacuolar-type H+-ATPase subunit D/Vma8